MSDKPLADAVREAAVNLSRAITAAAESGLYVDCRVETVERIGVPPLAFIAVTVRREV
jgi:hypothetical protein